MPLGEGGSHERGR